ncbi:MAG: TonB-dependent receptor [Gammaproteobacteria bacterium]|nr:TonB-dependent receptor [Gammaproteobacteria bacterium]
MPRDSSLTKKTIVTTLLAIGCTPALAEETERSEGIEEIVVTATKRGGINAQDVPGSITAFDENKLERLGVVDFDEMIVHVPGTNFIDNGGPGRGHEIASIRGLSPVADNTVSTTAQYLDGAPRFGRNYRMFDIGEVAILRGPQGTLWGSQSQGGLISFRSNRPYMNEFDAKLLYDGYNSKNADLSHRVAASVNIPVIEDKFAVRVAGHVIDEAGYIDNVLTGKDGINDVEESAWRISALYEPTDTSSFTLIYHGNDLEASSPNFFNLGTGDLNSDDPLTDLWSEQEFDLVNFIAEVEFRNMTLTYNGAYYDMTNDYIDVEEDIFGFIPLGRTHQMTTEESWTHELRLASNYTDNPWNWLVGVYSDDFDSDDLGVQKEVVDPTDPDWAAGVFVGFDIFVIGGPETFKETAIFGEVSYQFSEQVSVLVGARYFDWEVGNEQELTFFGSNFNQVTGEVDGDDVFYKFQLDYQPTDASLIYFSRSEGFRYGGFNPFVGLEGIGPDVQQFDPDTLVNYEIGFKTQWFDRRLIVNGAVFTSEWEDVQLVVLATPPSPWAYTTNAGNLDAEGAEIEFVSQDMLFPGFYFSGSYAYSKNEFTEDANPNNAERSLIEKGEELRRTPRNTWSFDIGYDFRIGDYDAFFRVNHWHRDSTTTEGFNGGDGVIDIKAQDVYNASFGVTAEKWTARLYVDNFTDERPFLQVVPNVIDNTLADRVSSIRPRTVGLQLTYRFSDF